MRPASRRNTQTAATRRCLPTPGSRQWCDLGRARKRTFVQLATNDRQPRLADIRSSEAIARNRPLVHLREVPQDADRDELELRVSDVLYEVAKFAWSDLAPRVPVGRTYVRPDPEGAYMAVTWSADWKIRAGGSILVKVEGYLDPDHQIPIWWAGEIIRKRSLLDRLLKPYGR